MLKRKILLVLLSTALIITTNSLAAFAADIRIIPIQEQECQEMNISEYELVDTSALEKVDLSTSGIDFFQPKATVTITDSEGIISKTTIPTEEILKNSTNVYKLPSGDLIGTSVVSIEVGDDLQKELASTKTSSTQTYNGNITIKTGMTYVFSGKNVKITKVHGSTTPKGMYYASNRKQYYRHPGNAAGGSWSPSTNSWSYSVNSGYGLYTTQAPPRATLDCRIRVSGMTAYQNITVVCNL